MCDLVVLKYYLGKISPHLIQTESPANSSMTYSVLLRRVRLIQVMANLNFQQPPRSIANSSINNRGSSFVGSGTSSLSGHVTPTSGMFPQSNASFATQSQLSPNRSGSVQLSGGFGQTLGNNSSGGAGSAVGGNTNQSARANLFGQRIIADRRQMPSLGPAVSCDPMQCNALVHFYQFHNFTNFG